MCEHGKQNIIFLDSNTLFNYLAAKLNSWNVHCACFKNVNINSHEHFYFTYSTVQKW